MDREPDERRNDGQFVQSLYIGIGAGVALGAGIEAAMDNFALGAVGAGLGGGFGALGRRRGGGR